MLTYIKPSSGFSDATIISESASVGKIFITDVTPTSIGNISNKLYINDTIPEDSVLTQCISDTNNITIHFIAEGGDNQSPIVSIGDTTCANLTQLVVNTRIFQGSITTTISGNSSIVLKSDTDQTASIYIAFNGPPVIQSISFTGTYPALQTELKSGDTYNIKIIADKSFNLVEIMDVGAFIAQTISVTDATSAVVTGTIANRGTTTTQQSATIRVRTATGSYSEYSNSNSASKNLDGTTIVLLNNIYPTITFNSITYPLTQKALKDSEVAIVNSTVTNYNTILYSSPNNQLNITDATTYQINKNATRIAGGYNIITSNFRITATRAANNAVTTSNTIVCIANDYQTISIAEQYSRLRSSVVGTAYTVTLTSSQKLLNTPTVAVPYGTFTTDFTTINNLVYTRNITVTDADTKGSFSYNSLYTTNWAGRIVSTITGDGTYIIGGFSTRRIVFSAFNRLQPIGTSVVLAAKLSCVDVGGYTFNYQSSKTNTLLGYTITDSDGNLNPTGNYIYVCDDNQVNQNSTGTAQIDLQEVI